MIGFEQKSGSPVITIGLAIVDGRITHRIFFYSEAYRPIALYQLGDKKQTQRLLLLHLITVPMTMRDRSLVPCIILLDARQPNAPTFCCF